MTTNDFLRDNPDIALELRELALSKNNIRTETIGRIIHSHNRELSILLTREVTIERYKSMSLKSKQKQALYRVEHNEKKPLARCVVKYQLQDVAFVQNTFEPSTALELTRSIMQAGRRK